ncbi:MAG: S-layer homology domain-containing protein [Phascolarctobacterium sp.]|nr:S-layer homology domain-containing protein [Phascolarctobacterium sp.]
MKKLSYAITLGLMMASCTAMAANPFDDVPSGHWAYDSIDKLAAQGVIEGYGDGNFAGNQIMTRYEMAQIVARAMARGADVGKLSAEFADELNKLGVRVENLEKKTGNVWINGHIRFSYKAIKPNDSFSEGRMRNLLWVSGRMNDHFTYTVRLQNDYRTNGAIDEAVKKNGWHERLYLNQAHVDYRNRDLHIRLGRQGFTYYHVFDSNVSGVYAEWGKPDKVYLEGFAVRGMAENGHMNALQGSGDSFNDPYVLGSAKQWDSHTSVMAGISKRIGAVTPTYRFYHTSGSYGRKIHELDVRTKVGSKWELMTAGYYGDQKVGEELAPVMQGNDNFGYCLGAYYGTMSFKKPGSWQLYATYYDRPLSTYYSPVIYTGFCSLPDRNSYAGGGAYEKDGKWYQSSWGYTTDGFKGWETGLKLCLAKNVTAAVRYIHVKDRDNRLVENKQERTVWSELVFMF